MLPISAILLCGKELNLCLTIRLLRPPKEKAFENIVGKGENAMLFSTLPNTNFDF